MKILLAVDGSDIGMTAVRHVVALSKSLKNAPKLTLLYVDLPLFKQAAAALGSEAVARYHAENGDYALKKARTALKRARLAFDERVEIGEIAETIVKQAQSGKADMIVMGSHGRGALKSLFIGSVAQKVVGTSPVPVVIAR